MLMLLLEKERKGKKKKTFMLMVVEIKKRMCKEYKEQRKVTCNMIFTVNYISKRRHFHFALFG